MDDNPQMETAGAMKKERDEAETLENQGDQLERFVDFSRPRPAVFPNLEPSTARVTLRMPGWPLAELKREANRRDMPDARKPAPERGPRKEGKLGPASQPET